MNLENIKYKLSFQGCEKIKENYSQAAQDIFVLSCLNGKKNGTFLDLGCRHPIYYNNTYLLERQYGWAGVSIDIDTSMIGLYNCRNTIALNEDCTKLNFEKIIDLGKTNHFDYLSLDLDPAFVTHECLLSIPFDKIEFSVITYEHDFYRFGEFYRRDSRKIFESNGYKRICSNVRHGENIFEDWYYNPKYVSEENIKILENSEKKKSEGHYKNYMKEGLWTDWHGNGQKQSEGYFKNGKREGNWVYWYDNGQKDAEGCWANNEKDGKWTLWYKNGQKESEGQFKNGDQVGLWTYWHNTGEKGYECHWTSDKKEGLWTYWHNNSQKWENILFTADRTNKEKINEF